MIIIIGISILAVMFLAFFFAAVLSFGIKKAIAMWASALSITALVVFASILITK
jgi:hypothetical protein